MNKREIATVPNLANNFFCHLTINFHPVCLSCVPSSPTKIGGKNMDLDKSKEAMDAGTFNTSNLESVPIILSVSQEIVRKHLTEGCSVSYAKELAVCSLVPKSYNTPKIKTLQKIQPTKKMWCTRQA